MLRDTQQQQQQLGSGFNPHACAMNTIPQGNVTSQIANLIMFAASAEESIQS